MSRIKEKIAEAFFNKQLIKTKNNQVHIMGYNTFRVQQTCRIKGYTHHHDIVYYVGNRLGVSLYPRINTHAIISTINTILTYFGRKYKWKFTPKLLRLENREQIILEYYTKKGGVQVERYYLVQFVLYICLDNGYVLGTS